MLDPIIENHSWPGVAPAQNECGRGDKTKHWNL